MDEEVLLKMSLGKDGNLSATMSVKDSKEVIAVLIDVELEDMGIFHGFSPATHLGKSSDKVIVFFLKSIFFEIGFGPKVLVFSDGHMWISYR